MVVFVYTFLSVEGRERERELIIYDCYIDLYRQ
jgi:hypothetical protein